MQKILLLLQPARTSLVDGQTGRRALDLLFLYGSMNDRSATDVLRTALPAARCQVLLDQTQKRGWLLQATAMMHSGIAV